jgi:hypothetical protein
LASKSFVLIDFGHLLSAIARKTKRALTDKKIGIYADLN